MKIKDLVINEGVIEVPPELIERCMTELKKVVATYIYNNISDSDMAQYMNVKGFIPIKHYGAKYEPNDWVAMTKIGYSSGIVKYADEERGVVLSLGAVIDRDERVVKKTVQGSYRANNNTLMINLTALMNNLDDELDITVMYNSQEEYNATSLDDRKEMVSMMITPEISRSVKEFFGGIVGTVEHELAHHIQYEFLRAKHPDQVQSAQTNDSDDYFTSTIEYSPQIISAAKGFMHEMDQWKKINLPNKFMSIWGKYLTGTITLSMASKETSSIEGIPVFYKDYLLPERIAARRHFFMALKEKDRKQWKKAVKYFYSKVNESLDALDP